MDRSYGARHDAGTNQGSPHIGSALSSADGFDLPDYFESGSLDYRQLDTLQRSPEVQTRAHSKA
jgi:hypothetical protein